MRQYFQIENHWARCRALILIGCLALSLTGCEACSDQAGQSPEAGAPPGVGLPPPPPGGEEPPVVSPQPPGPGKALQSCTATSLTYTALDGTALALPVGPATLPATLVAEVSAPVRAVAFVTNPDTQVQHRIWNEGGTIKTMVASRGMGSTIHDLAVYHEAGAARLAVAADDGLHLLPLSLTADGVQFGDETLHMPHFGRVTGFAVADEQIVEAPVQDAPLQPASGVDVSLNVLPPGTPASDTRQAIITFVTEHGDALALQQLCLGNLYTAGQMQHEGHSLLATDIATAFPHVALVVTDRQPLAIDPAIVGDINILTGLGADTDLLRNLGVTAAHLHDAARGVQQIVHVDLAQRTTTSLPLVPPPAAASDLLATFTDQLIHDIAIFQNHLMVSGALFSRAQLDAAHDAAARAGLIPQIINKSASPETLEMLRGQLVAVPLEGNAPARLITVPEDGGTPSPFGVLTVANNQLWYRGRQTYATLDSPAGELAALSVQGVAMLPRTVRVTPDGTQLVAVLHGAIGHEVITVADNTVQQIPRVPRPQRVHRAFVYQEHHYLLYRDTDGSQVLHNLSTDTRQTLPSLGLSLLKAGFTSSGSHVDVTFIGGKAYVIMTAVLHNTTTKTHTAHVAAYAIGNLPKKAGEHAGKQIAKFSASLDDSPAGALFAGSAAFSDTANPAIADMVADQQTIHLLIEHQQDGNQPAQYYRTVLLAFDPQKKSLTLFPAGTVSNVLPSDSAKPVHGRFVQPVIGNFVTKGTKQMNYVWDDTGALCNLYQSFPIAGTTLHNMDIVTTDTALAATRLGQSVAALYADGIRFYLAGKGSSMLVDPITVSFAEWTAKRGHTAQIRQQLYVASWDETLNARLQTINLDVTATGQLGFAAAHYPLRFESITELGSFHFVAVSAEGGIAVYEVK